MKHRNLFFSLLAIIFVSCFGISAFAQRPTTSPTGSGNSTKPRPKDVSQIAIQRILAKVKLPQSSKQAEINPIIETTATVEKIEPYKTPDITETTWFVKGETEGKKWAEIISFKSGNVLQFEHYGFDGDVVTLTGTWRQIGEDLFATIKNPNTNDSSAISATITNGLMKGSWKRQGQKDWNFTLQSDEVLSLRKMLADAEMPLQNFRKAKNYDKVIETYKKISLSFPKYDRIHSDIGETYVDMKDYANALNEFSKAIELAPQKYDGYYPDKEHYFYKRGKIYYEYLKDNKKAISDLEMSFQLNIEYGTHEGRIFTNAFSPLVKLYLINRDFSSALAVCNKQIARDEKFIKRQGYISRSLVYETMGNLDEALNDSIKAVEIDPVKESYAARAKIYNQKGDVENAKKDYSEAAKAVTNDGWFNYGLDNLYELACRYYSLAGEFEKANPICTDGEKNKRLYFSRGFWYFHQGKYDEAVADFSKALDLNSNDSEIYNLRAKAYSKLGKTELATADEKKAKDIENSEIKKIFDY